MSFLVLLTALSTLLSNLATKTLQSDISLTMQEKGQVALTSPGKVTMQGQKFIGSARGYEVAYDGSTMYMYDPDANELTLSHPIQEDLVMSNPLLFAQSIAQVSTARETVSKDGLVTTVTLVPKGTPQEMMKVVLKIKNGLPIFVEVQEPQYTVSLRLKNPQYVSTAPSFVVKKDGAYINDIR
ncbi:MAG: outer membrane lipoprotein carrier protein LolA [Paludibacteraceae bacterium]|nr:outer membrane lipoprotein carrier protein LolA [Paludibacteraceae bacterium]